MTHCKSCRMLSFTPQRRDIPSHLRRNRDEDLRFGWIRLTAYECVHCASTWRWYGIDGWARAEVSPDARPAQRLAFGGSLA